MAPDAVIAKFMASASLTVPTPKAQRVCAAVLELERISARELAAALRGRD